MASHSSLASWTPDYVDRRLLLKLLAVVEVVTFISLSMMAALWAQARISPGLADTLGLMSGGAPDFLASALAMTKGFGVQYGVLLVLVLVTWGLARTSKPMRAYGLSGGDRPFTQLIGLGVAAGFILSILTQSVFVARELWDLGPGTAIWAIAEREPWDWTFWIFMGVGSFALVPILEELAWRGYVVGRLMEHFRPGAAIVFSTLFFSAWHLQYFIDPDLSKVMVIVGLVASAMVFALLTLKTGSLWPALIAHGIVNTPADLFFGLGKIGIGLAVLILFHRAVGDWLRLLGRWLWDRDVVLVLVISGLIGALGYVGLTNGAPMPMLLGAGLVLAGIGSVFNRARWSAD